MNNYKGIVIHFGEIWLKGRNRNSFVRRLYYNVEAALKNEKYAKLEQVRDRFFLILDKKSNLKSINEKLSYVFGISWYAPAITCENKLEDMVSSANKLLGKKDKVRIVANRSFKGTKFNSYDIVTHFIKNTKKLKFTIDKDSEKDFFINVTKEYTFIYDKRLQGPKGLPVGCSGNAVVLLSGGIDSPVAAFYAMKRGLHLIYMHVHAFSNNKDKNLSKISELVKHLSKYSPNSKLYLIPGYVFQSSALKTPRKYELVIFKLFMYRLAEKIAAKEKAECIVSGESLGQVASQTTSNLTTSEHGIKLFVMRPVIGFDKQEIINVAKQIGTFDMSIAPYKDVCSIAAKDPATSSTYKSIIRFWKDSNMEAALAGTLKKTSSITIE